MSQTDEVLAALKKGDHITPLDALKRFGSLRLADIIYRLRAQGWQIETDMVTVGKEKKRVASYWLMSQKPRVLYFGRAAKGL